MWIQCVLLEGTSAERETERVRAQSWVRKPRNPDAMSQTSTASEGLNRAASDVIRDRKCVSTYGTF